MIESQASGAVSLPWGDGPPLTFRLPESWPAPLVFEPDLSGAIADYPAALERALDDPLASEPLEALVGPGRSVAIIVDDPSRWTPIAEALPIVLDRLKRAGVAERDISVSVGVGRHHAVDDATMRRRLGHEIVETYECFSPRIDDRSAYDDLGETEDGIPVRIFRPVARADLRILIGSVLPHLQAGFGGGAKLIVPGTSHRSTLGAAHRQGLRDGDPRRLIGSKAADNPMRRAIGRAVTRLGPSYSISHVLGDRGRVFMVKAGSLEAVQDTLAAEVERRFRATVAEPFDLVIAGSAPWPGDPLQSFKVLLNHQSACRPGGVLLGAFWTDPAEIDRSMPLSALRSVAATGAWGGWALKHSLSLTDRIVAALGLPSAFMVRWARELVVDREVLVLAPPLRERLGPRLGPVRLLGDPEALGNEAEARLDALGVSNPRAAVFPYGGLTYCRACE